MSGRRKSAAIRVATKDWGNGHDDWQWSRYRERLVANIKGLNRKDTLG